MRVVRIAIATVLLSLSWFVVAPSTQAAPGDIYLASVASDGTQGDANSMQADLSADGRFVVFRSAATNLVDDDTNGRTDIFVRDLKFGTTERISVASDGSEGNGDCDSPAMSADGRFIAFFSEASNLVSGDTNGQGDVFVHDRETGTTERVSVASDGSQATDQLSDHPSVSGDGRFVAFHSTSAMLTDGDTHAQSDVFVHDRITGTTELVSVTDDGRPPNAGSDLPSISDDGQRIAFESRASTLDGFALGGIYVRDRVAGTTIHVSATSDGTAPGIESRAPSISADGQVVAFQSWSKELLGEANHSPHGVFVHDLRTGVTDQVNVAPNGLPVYDWSESPPAISADGRFVAFDSDARELSPDDSDDTWDVFVRDRERGTTVLVSIGVGGTPATSGSGGPAISADGSRIAFQSYAFNLVNGDANDETDIFVSDVDMRTGWFSIGNPLFERTWARTDRPVAATEIDRTWMWGPLPLTTTLREPYVDSQGGERVVQYFDKARMELTYPNIDPASSWAVTNGLLVTELITGRMQVGDAMFEQHDPANLNIAGDTNDHDGPTYRTFSRLLDDPPLHDDAVIIQSVDRTGNVTADPHLAWRDVRAGPLIPETNHRVASVFWDFLHSRGLVYGDGLTTTERLFEPWYYASGLPITEAYWTAVRVDGIEREVLVQAFERRVLTYTPDNPEGWQVEAGNVGQHYYYWRYGQPPAEPSGTIAFLRTIIDSETGEQFHSAATIQADGTDLHMLGQVEIIGVPRMSPDGQFVAWSERVGERFDVFVANADGSARRNLTAATVTGGANPDWSPDGSQIAYDSGMEVWIIGADGSSPRMVASGWGARWSPDGTRLAFNTRTDLIGRYHGIGTVRADGTDLAGVAGCAGNFAWTPDSREIVAYHGSYIGCGWANVFIVGADGSNPRPLEPNLPDGATMTEGFAFSPDGTRVVFTVYSGEDQDLYVANADFSGAQPLTSTADYDIQPCWSPDGAWVAFTRLMTGGSEIYVVEVENPDNVRQVTNDEWTGAESPSW